MCILLYINTLINDEFIWTVIQNAVCTSKQVSAVAGGIYKKVKASPSIRSLRIIRKRITYPLLVADFLRSFPFLLYFIWIDNSAKPVTNKQGEKKLLIFGNCSTCRRRIAKIHNFKFFDKSF